MKKTIIASALALSIAGGAAATSTSAMTMYKEPPFEAYKVDKGDTFYFIAKRYGLDYKELMKLNPNVDPYNMKVGSILRLKPENQSTTTPTSSQSSVSAYEQEVVKLVNAERAKAGLQPLQVDNEVAKTARLKSQDMHDNHYFDHNSPTYGSPFDMMKQFGITYKAAGENIAQGQQTPAEVMKAWMNSPGHKANILSSKYTHIGVGYVKDGNYWTQQFIGK
ncbi:LysM peptidoglycan-binding domain-containing protein [Priestia filamentosa]|uniref:CAP domain-containing protein n=1 Tax=Priestia filamentosa TaxID=1402861 RepID=UPI001FB4E26D|nr:CAP domain-containing protein [Priestia filamentosa]MED3729000.1 CAP domain-containing protein [Priestia filamentosa]UOE58781.1 LysM peptidoglycan-binding domain-containing protein [Priestia filamentosa]